MSRRHGVGAFYVDVCLVNMGGTTGIEHEAIVGISKHLGFVSERRLEL